MLNDFMNSFDKFKSECNKMSEEEFLAPFLEFGIEFVPIEETKTRFLDGEMLKQNIVFVYSDSNVYQKQLIA